MKEIILRRNLGVQATTMGVDGYIFCFILFIQVFNTITGQLIPQEELRNVTSCDLTVDVDLSCGSNEVIAIHSLYFWYHATCDGTCCSYDSSHFSVGADQTVTQDVRRQCSGRNACSIGQLNGIRNFEGAGAYDPSYVVIKYYCIPVSRTTSICSDDKLTSSGKPLYLTNPNYPSVTTGDSTCSCSLEVFSCTSSVNLYIIDADMYLDESNCEQSIDFVDGTGASLKKVNCANFYQNTITETNFDTNYVKIDFIEDSTQDQEGYFFLGFGVSEDVAFKLSCSYEEQSICRDCGAPGFIPHGMLGLVDTGNSSYGALAKVVCDNGYEPDNATASCLDTGLWETVTCSPKDCGTPYDMSNGTITLVNNGTTTFGARANVICDEGFEIKGNCNGSDFQCGDGTCISDNWRCDNQQHCVDNLDELLCDGVISCLEGQVLCDTTCIDSQDTCEVGSTTDSEIGTGTISCLVIGKWEIVKCSAKDCGDPGDIQNGTFSLTEPGITTYQSTASVTCNTGFMASAETISCLANGTWEAASCIIDCGTPENVDGADVTTSNGNFENSVATYICKNGYKQTSGDQERTCGPDGNWNGTSPVCTPDCGTPPSVDGATVSTSNGNIENSVATYVCGMGFLHTSGDLERTCGSDSNWNGTLPVCTPDCGTPPNVDGATVTTSNGNIENSVATYVCGTGYLHTTGDLERTCGSDSNWNGTSPVCIPDCGTPKNVNGASVTTSNGNIENSVATYVCGTGYLHTSGDLERTCGSDSNWKGTTPVCTPDCGTPENVNGASVTTSNGNIENSVATYVCGTGYLHTSGDLERTCGSDSNWNGTTPVCTPDCGTPENVNGASVTTSNGNIENSVATYVCGTGYLHTSGDLERTCGSDSNWNGTTPVCTPDCGTPENVNGASVTTSNGNIENSVATYVCGIGYLHTSGDLERTCGSDSNWNGTTPVCTPDCGTPENVNGASVTTSNGNIENSVATYGCGTGYLHISGDLERTCGSDSNWNGTSPVCTPDCGTPENVNGASVTTSNGNIENSVATYVCATGYLHTFGHLERTCGSDSNWNGTTPICTPDCGTPENVNGASVTTSNGNIENSVATYVCGTGYLHTSGDLERTCGSDSNWNGTTPVCTTDCGTPENVNGASVMTSNGNIENSVATYVCATGYLHTSGDLERTCGSDSNWNGTTPVCTPDCGTPENVNSASVTTSNGNIENSVATYVCGIGYLHTSGDLERTCGSDGNWNGTTPICTPDCGTPENVNGASVTTSNGNIENSVATYVCGTGYLHTSGDLERTCGSDSHWNGTSPVCTLDCGTPENVNGASVTTSNGNIENSVATYVCGTGYLHTSGDLERTCGSDSNWNGTTPVCTTDCGTPENVNGASVTTSNGNIENSVATYVCGTGYLHTSGDLERTCGSDSNWNGTTPVCTPDCGTPENVNGASVTTSNGNIENSVATYVCGTGYLNTSGDLERTCGSDSNWNGTSPVCTPDCGTPENVNGASVTTSNGNIENSVATYVCGTGYLHTSGDLERTCGSDSNWNGTTPVCTPDCGTPENVNGASVSTSNGNIENSVATYVCGSGYLHTSGDLERTCGSDSNWNGTTPVCTPDCGTPENVNGASVTTSNGNIENSVATYVCGTGYLHISGDLERTCGSDSNWNGTSPVCTPDCGTPENVNGASVTTSNGNIENSVAKYVCATGYLHTFGHLERTCGSDSNWNGTTPICTPDCGTPENVNGASVTTSNGYIENSVATYVCGTGYLHTSGDLERTCGSDSNWNGTTPVCTTDCGTPENVNGASVTTSNGNIENSVATYVCGTGYLHISGDLERTCGSDSNWNGTSPVCTPDCGTPENVNGASVTTSNGNIENSVATYVCATGYLHTFGHLERTCGSDSNWNGTTPICTPDCGTPENVNGASVTTSNGNIENSVATYVCGTGYLHTSGDLERTCGSDSNWNGTTPVCTTDCGTPENVNGASVTTSNGNIENSVATYVCGTGYLHTSGDLERTCGSDSNWNGTSPVCTPDIDCGTPENVNGASVTTSNGTIVKSVATYVCENGYTHTSGILERTCGSDGNWSGTPPVCTPDCGSTYLLANGRIELGAGGNTTYLSTASVICVSGFHPTTNTILCQANGTWEIAFCVISVCGQPPVIANGKIVLNKENETTSVSTATVICNTGFKPTSQKISCQDNEEWENATCEIKDCGVPNNVDNGNITLVAPGETTYLSTATLSCEIGFGASADTITCEASGAWQNASCVLIDCGNPVTIANGTISVDVEGETTYLSNASVICETGFDKTSDSISCQASGVWQNASCLIKDCGNPNTIDNGTIVLDPPGTTTYLSTANVLCETGFDMSTDSVSCQASGTWTNATCVIKDCGNPKSIDNGTIVLDHPGTTTYLSTAKVLCETGFDMSTDSVSCQASGTWTNATCVIKDCGDPNTIANGTINVDLTGKTTYLSTASVSCETGFDKSSESISCQASGVWQNASCVIKDCGILDTILNGTIVLDSSGKTTYLSTARVSCETGFDKSIDSISCQANGTWEDASCIIKDCGVPNTIYNGTIAVDSPGKTTYLSTATVSCEIGFDKSADSISCQTSGTWEDVSCIIKDCGSSYLLANGSIDIAVGGKTTYLSSASVSCVSGFHPTTDSILCQADGQWELAYCVISDCGNPPVIANGKIVLNKENDTTFVSTATVVCDVGFSTKSRNISCQANDTWENATCEIKDCGVPDNVDNGNITLVAPGKTTYLSTATLSCKIGFDESIDIITCQASGAWQDASCGIIDCGIPDAIDSGNVSVDIKGKTTYLSTATISCETGFDGSSDSISCQSSGSWSVAYCVIKDCADPTTIDNGTITVAVPGKTTYLSTATVSCESGFNESMKSILCQANGFWQNASCVRKDCGVPNTIINGTITEDVPDTTTYLSTATVTCDPGFDASVDSISCQARGAWSGASCVIKDCGAPPKIDNGSIVLYVKWRTSYGSSAAVECQTGFIPTNTSVVCLVTGHWEKASCISEALDCGPLPNLENGQISLSTAGMTQVGETAIVSCNKGYIKSVSSVMCSQTGQWQQASCDIIDCGVPPSILHGVVEVLEGSFTTYDSVAHVTCHEGYRTEQQFVACEETGTWEISTCIPEDYDDDIVIILGAAGGSVLLLALIILIVISLMSRSKKTSANLHTERMKRDVHYFDNNFTEVDYSPAKHEVTVDEEFPLDDAIETIEGSPLENGGDMMWLQYQLPEQEHVLFPDDINRLEENVFKKHEPHMWHPDMHTHTEGSEYDWDFSPYHF